MIYQARRDWRLAAPQLLPIKQKKKKKHIKNPTNIRVVGNDSRPMWSAHNGDGLDVRLTDSPPFSILLGGMAGTIL